MSDQNIRKLCLHKLTYSKYCAKCKYCVKAEWNPNQGVKYGIIDVACCVNGGKFIDDGKVICPNGVAWGVRLGESETFNPEDWKRDKTEESLYVEGQTEEQKTDNSDPQKHLGNNRQITSGKSLPVNKVIQGDSIEVLNIFPEESVDLVMFSPPYWGLRNYGEKLDGIWSGDSNCEHEWGNKIILGVATTHGATAKVGNTIKDITKGIEDKGQFCSKCGAWRGQLGLEPHPTQYIQHMVEVCRAIRRVLKKSGSMYIVVGDTYFGGGSSAGATINPDDLSFKAKSNIAMPKKSIRNFKSDDPWLQPKQKLDIPSRLWHALQEDGWILRNKIIWYKHNPMPESCVDRYTQCYEEIGFFVKPPAKGYYFDMKAVLKPLQETTIKRCKSPYGDDVKKGYRIETEGQRGFAEKVKFKEVSGRHPWDVWEINTKSLHLPHVAVYPEELCIDPIKTTAKNAVILDPMCGSGTTLVVAHKLGRRWIGIDISEDNVLMARKRLNKVGAYSKKLGEFQ